ncbi:MAG: hypothetical protein R2873_08780 [Caldilineaceae bacterium]
MDIRIRVRKMALRPPVCSAAITASAIYLTAYAGSHCRAKIAEPRLLIKPFEERELYSTIEMALYKVQMEKRLQTEAARLHRSTVPEGIALSTPKTVLCWPISLRTTLPPVGVAPGDVLHKLGDCSIDDCCSRHRNPKIKIEVLSTASSAILDRCMVIPTLQIRTQQNGCW